MKKEVEIDPKDGLKVLEHMFGSGDWEVENFKDWCLKYIPGPIYRIPRHIGDFLRAIKWVIQRIFRKSHASDCDIWNLSHHMARSILPKLIAFKKSSRMGYPSTFSDWDEENPYSLGMDKKEYDAAVKKGDMKGGGEKAWEKVIDEIIFAFEYQLYHDEYGKKQEAMFAKYDILDPHRKTDDNLSWGYNYKTDKGESMFCSEEDHIRIQGVDKEKYKGYVLIGKHRSYYNVEDSRRQWDRVTKGMKLFGEYFWSLWD